MMEKVNVRGGGARWARLGFFFFWKEWERVRAILWEWKVVNLFFGV
jgi:hypothetical protein